MQKKILFIFVLITQIQLCFSQTNMSLLGEHYFGERAMDIWGYVDEFGNEYAIVGLASGVSILDVTNPSSINEVFYTSGVYNGWRDIKVFDNKAYITNEGDSGIMIIDLSPLPSSNNLSVINYNGNQIQFTSAHNLYIDEYGFCYVFGAKNNGADVGTIILNLNASINNSNFEAGIYDDYYLHDGVVRGDTLWGGAVYDGFFTVVNVTNKLNPITVAVKNTPSNFTHNCWISDDGQTLFTTDEKSNAYIAAYDVGNLSNITELDRVQSSPGMQVIPHNTHFINNYLVTSYYRDGVTVHDVSNPQNMVEVGNYDTSPAYSGDGFNGCWGVYPWLPSGNIIASDIENGLFVLGVNYTRACHIKGNVTNLNTSAPIDGVQIELLTTGISSNSNIIGDYITGTVLAGNYDVAFSKPGFYSDTIYNVSLTNGNTTTLNVQLEPFHEFVFSGKVLESSTLTPISNAEIHLVDTLSDISLFTDAMGNFSMNNLKDGNYLITVGKWGYVTKCTFYKASNDTINYVVLLDQGYYDDFSLDFNWIVSGDATSGIWEKAIPVGLKIGPVSVTPEYDVNSDCGESAFVTGNSGQNGGEDDLAGGTTVLTSPSFDATLYANPFVDYQYWFYTGFGSSQDDEMIFKIDNGVYQVVIDQVDVNSPGKSSWVNKSFQLSNFITLTNNMRFIIEIGDLGNLNVTEGAFDQFMIRDVPLSTSEIKNKESKIYPNPFNEIINIELDAKDVKIELLDITGRILDVYMLKNQQKIKLTNQYNKGIYFLNIYSKGELIETQQMVKY